MTLTDSFFALLCACCALTAVGGDDAPGRVLANHARLQALGLLPPDATFLGRSVDRDDVPRVTDFAWASGECEVRLSRFEGSATLTFDPSAVRVRTPQGSWALHAAPGGLDELVTELTRHQGRVTLELKGWCVTRAGPDGRSVRSFVLGAVRCLREGVLEGWIVGWTNGGEVTLLPRFQWPEIEEQARLDELELPTGVARPAASRAQGLRSPR